VPSLAPPPTAPATLTVAPGGALVGRGVVPGDKSISQRAALLGALADGETRIAGFLRAADPLALLGALAACGVAHRFEVGAAGEPELVVRGRARWQAPAAALALGNSGTALRLLAGAIAGQPFAATLTGDASLSLRPMERIAAPLRAMGATVTTADGTPPVTVRGARPLRGIHWTPEVASAQVKSAILIAGLAAEGEVAVREPVPTRDHTERLLGAFGVACARDGDRVRLGAARRLVPTRIAVPGDLSSAAFLIVGAAMTPGSDLVVEGVGLNPTRCAVLEVLRAMGADLAVETTSAADAVEPVGRIAVRGRVLTATAIEGRLALQAMDELPMLMVAAATARGTTRLAGAAELRHKESDRLANTAAGLAALGAAVALRDDGMEVEGGALDGGRIDAHDDHRLAMAFAMAALRARRPIVVTRAAAIATSFPGFHPLARGLGLDLALETAA
jgi:3-phosphoshikimate 1-carboxyvinyltransferase